MFRRREILPRGNASKVFAKNIGLNIDASFLLEMKNKPIPEGSPFPEGSPSRREEIMTRSSKDGVSGRRRFLKVAAAGAAAAATIRAGAAAGSGEEVSGAVFSPQPRA